MKAKKTKAKKSTKHEVIVRVQSVPTPVLKETDLDPIKEKNKYMIPQNNWLSEKQVIQMVQKTPPQHIYTRPAKGGGRWSYVTGSYVEKVLNFTFGWNWDFEVQSHGKEGDQVWVLGKLTVKDSKTERTIVKTQFGRADIKFKKDTKIMLDFGNDLKAATTDSLKKCASLLGIASDIYGKMEIKAETGAEIAPSLPAGNVAPQAQNVALKAGQVMGPDGKPTYVCSNCDTPINDEVAAYSQKIYGKKLCRDHQKK